MATLDEPVGPVVEAHGTEAAPGPVTVHPNVPVGVTPPVPVTVAVKTRSPPVDTPGVLSMTATVGVDAGLIWISLTVASVSRSEERRVGKECTVLRRSRWSPYH